MFSPDQERAILANAERRDYLALRLLLKVGIRKGALQGVRFRHFNHAQKRLTIFTKGGKVQTGADRRPGLLGRARAAHP